MRVTVKSFKAEEQQLMKFINNKSVVAILKETNAMIAGGALTSLFTGAEINDLDLYFRSYEDLEKFIRLVQNEDGSSSQFGYEDLDCDVEAYYIPCQGMTKKSLLFSHGPTLKLQCIHLDFYTGPHKIFATFDFTINMCAYDFKYEQFVFHENFFKDLGARQLRINTATAFPMISVVRIDKYKQRGYKISRKDLFGLLLAIANLKIDSWEDLAEHIGGMYGYTYEDLFDTTKEFSIDEGLNQLSNIESKMDDVLPPAKSFTDNIMQLRIEHGLFVEPKFFYKGVEVKGSKLESPFRNADKLNYVLGETLKKDNHNGIYAFYTVQQVRDRFKGRLEKGNINVIKLHKGNCKIDYQKSEVIMHGDVYVDPCFVEDSEAV